MNEKLLSVRIKKGWSQEQAAEVVGVATRTYQRWEHGFSMPNFGSRRMLCKAFEVSYEELGFDLEDTGETKHRNDIISIQNIFETDIEPWERLIGAYRQPSALNSVVLDYFERLIYQCWDLSNSNQLEVAESILSSFLPRVLTISQVDKRTASLVSQGLRLQSILIHHRLNLTDKILLCKKSVDYARQSSNVDTLVTALIELAGSYEYTGQAEKRFITLQEALYYSAQASPLVQSRAHSRNAVVCAETGRKREALFHIELARETFSDILMENIGFAPSDSNIFRFAYHSGLVCLHNGDMAHIFDAFESYKSYPSGSTIPERIRLEIVNGQSRAAILMNDLERYAILLEDVITNSLVIGSRKRFEEAYQIFQQEMPATWLGHHFIQVIIEKYSLRRASA